MPAQANHDDNDGGAGAAAGEDDEDDDDDADAAEAMLHAAWHREGAKRMGTSLQTQSCKLHLEAGGMLMESGSTPRTAHCQATAS